MRTKIMSVINNKFAFALLLFTFCLCNLFSQVNYIRTWDAKAPEQNPNTLMTKSLRDVQQTTQYFDGLGRPLQTVVKQGSYPTGGTAVDMVSMVEYDDFGRETQKYLPFASTATDGSQNNGSYKTNALTQQNSFYISTDINKNPIAGQNETFFYSQTNYEPSPLNRVQEQFAPGNSWVGTSAQAAEANRKSVKIKYYVNTTTDGVRIWNVTNAAQGSFGGYASPGAYPAGELYKTITIDEHNKQVIEFKDKEGKVILKKVQLTAAADDGAGKDHTGWLCTYYIYDDLGNLRCVIQPKGVDFIKSNWVLNGTLTLTRLCFRYEYDQRNRMIMKKVPGADPVYMVYDARDRLVMTQDGRNREISQPIWMVTLYDELNRPTLSGSLRHSYLNNKSFAIIMQEAAQSTSYPFASAPTSSDWTERITTGYDNFDGIGALPSGLTTTFDATWLTSNYMHTTYNSSPEYAQPVTASNQTRGMVTWSKSVVIGYSQFLYSLNFYDGKGRLIQVKSNNYSGGIDVTTTQYNWAGQPLRIIQKHEKAGTPAQTSVVVTDMIYDDLGRLVTTRKKISNSLVNGGSIPALWTTIADNEYDALGQLAKKKAGRKKDNNGNYTTEALANLEYTYNIRGWLTAINKKYIDSDNSDRYFAMELGYDKDVSLGSYIGKQYNGNISTVLWKSAGDGQRRKYDFSYDAVNRFTKGNFGQYVSGSAHSAIFDKTTAGLDFTEEVNEYDAIGNIIRLKRYGYKPAAGSALIDDLEYTYENGVSTKLSKVKDNVAADPGSGLGDFTDGANTTDDYGYNGNGSITKDLNKGISNIVHHTTINLPYTITFANNKGNMEFYREATGTKLAKKVVENSVTVPYMGSSYNSKLTTTTTYLGSFIYETKDYELATLNPLDYKDKLQLVNHEEGRIRALYNNTATPNTPTGFVYDYFLKDHLGNIRMVLTDEQKQDIYPAATLEGSLITNGSPNAVFKEKDYYTIDPTKIVPKIDATGITDYPNHNGNPPVNNNPNSVVTANSAKLYKLNSTANKTGLGITLKVMAGDRIDIFGKSYYFTNNTGGTSANSAIPVLDILTGLLGGPTGGAAAVSHGGITASQLNGSSTTTAGINTLLSNQTANAATAPLVPKAYINYIFFDDQFKSTATGFSKVGVKSVVTPHTDLSNLTATKSGYVYIYVSNESPVNVFFDNLQIIHTRSAILEETHYYPFGLTMAGISSKALNNTPENKYKYNGIEQNNDFDLNMYDAFYRNLDPQIGRFWQIDPKPDYSHSTYSSMGNNPIRYSDFFGDTIVPIGTQQEIQRLTKAIDIVSQTNPEDFAIVNNSSENVLIGIADLNPGRNKNPSNSNNTSTIRFGEGEQRVDNNGEFISTSEAYGGLEQNSDGSFSRLTYTDDGDRVRVNINEQDANKLVKIKSAAITIDVNLGKKDFMKTIAHEIGHGAHAFQNRAQSFFYKGDPELKGHDRGNPSGIRATDAEKQFLKNYNKVKKQFN